MAEETIANAKVFIAAIDTYLKNQGQLKTK